MGAMKRVTASAGRCDICGLEKAAWTGQGIRLCDACCRRESRRVRENHAKEGSYDRARRSISSAQPPFLTNSVCSSIVVKRCPVMVRQSIC